MYFHTLWIRNGVSYSREFIQENCVPQGSILSVTQFAIAINGIVSIVRTPVEYVLYIDNFTIVCRAASLRMSERQLQLTVHRLSYWADSCGFHFSTAKTQVVHFCRRCGIFRSPEVLLYGFVLLVSSTVKFLGLLFDITLLRLYIAVVRNKLDYGNAVYCSAQPFVVTSLASVYHAGICVVTRAFRTSPVVSLCGVAGEPPLHYRRDQMLLFYSVRVHLDSSHLHHAAFLHPPNERLYSAKPDSPQPTSVLFAHALKRYALPLCVLPLPHLEQPWLTTQVEVGLNQAEFP
ncbi:hypothetical protein PR048_015265 [Dryococelus australis]|uniref:Reverse transcriptase domain-containing protein n=1 Tax=Dryococelus australis TaxID=614101 RepID=A0ABQ9HGF9_9NEOP|nr:hypothetical protein PR048_015265 [Dryococelus australis]